MSEWTRDDGFVAHNAGARASRGIGLAVVGVLLGAAALNQPAQAQPAFPSRPIEINVGFTAGSSVDIIARTIGERMQKSLGQPVIVRNVPGASGNLAVEAAARAQPDGHTLVLAGNASLVVNQYLFDKLAYNPATDLAPISQVAVTPNILVVNNTLPVKSLDDFVALARAKPGTIAYGHAGVGTSQHLAAVFLSDQARLDLQAIPYRGGPAIYSDLIEGRIQACFCNIVTALPLIRDGKLRPLAVTSLKRAAAAPDIPTLDEAGFKGVDSSAWFGFLAAVGTPAAVIELLQREIRNALTPDIRKSFEDQGIIVIGDSSPALAATIKSESAYWEKTIKEKGLKAQP